MRAVLISTYDLGRQPFGLASPAAWLGREGFTVDCVDLAKTSLSEADIRAADLVAIHLPMHTATRLAGPVIRLARSWNAGARFCAYGLYAPLNGDWLRSLGVDDVFGGEFEGELARIARELLQDRPDIVKDRNEEIRASKVPRLQFIAPDRSTLPPLDRYATLHVGPGETRVVGYTEASRGCRHRCRHCPVVPIYDGQFRVVPVEVVLADVAAQVAAGAQHITFGDPDFLNGPAHAERVVRVLHDAYPSTTYDVTAKIEHLLRYRALLPHLRETGCLFVTSAVESIDDHVLRLLDKGHTRQDFFEAVGLCREVKLTLNPTFVAFHPWLTLEAYCGLLDTIARLQLVDNVAPIQLAIRLLVPEGSHLLRLGDVRKLVGSFDRTKLAYPWTHPDPRVDALHAEVTAVIGHRMTARRRLVFNEVSALAHERANLPAHAVDDTDQDVTVPYLSEPWYCCAEPAPEQLRMV